MHLYPESNTHLTLCHTLNPLHLALGVKATIFIPEGIFDPVNGIITYFR